MYGFLYESIWREAPNEQKESCEAAILRIAWFKGKRTKEKPCIKAALECMAFCMKVFGEKRQMSKRKAAKQRFCELHGSKGKGAKGKLRSSDFANCMVGIDNHFWTYIEVVIL